MIYLDYAANTPVDPQVLETYVSCEREYTANPNSAHPLGVSARRKAAEVTDGIASVLGIDASCIVYTSGASEANNTALKGLAEARKHIGRHIVSTPLEHPSVSEPLKYLREHGWEIDLVNVGRDGKIDVPRLKELIRSDTVLITAAAADSELGAVQSINELVKIKREHPNCALHVDATQAIGKIPFSFAGIDAVSFTAHKFYGPNGIGVLYKDRAADIGPLIHGGVGTSPLRGGTPPLALAAALEKALCKASCALNERYVYIKRLNERLRSFLSQYPAVRINSPQDALPHILNLSVSGVKGTRFRDALGERGVCVSVRSACSEDGAPSNAVLAVSGDRKTALSSWRISLSHLTTDEEITRFSGIFDDCYKKLVR